MIPSPRFGVSVNVQIENLQGLPARQQLAPPLDSFAARMKRVRDRDKDDPISVAVNVSPDGSSALLRSNTHGRQELGQEAGESFGDFLGRLAGLVESWIPGLMSQEERETKLLEAVRQAVDGFATPLAADDFKYVGKAENPHWAHEVGFNFRSADAAIVELAGQPYQVDKREDKQGGITYEFTALAEEGSPIVRLSLSEEATQFTYRKGRMLVDVGEMHQSGEESTRFNVGLLLARTKDAIGALERAEVWGRE